MVERHIKDLYRRVRVTIGYLRLIFGFSAALLTSGGTTACSSLGAHQAFTYRQTSGNRNPDKVLTYSYDPALATPSHPFFKAAYYGAGTKQPLVRNAILYELMGMVDDYYFQYTTELRRDIAGKGILADTAGLATSAAATAAGGENLKTMLSAISTGVQGVSKSIDANVLLGNTIQAIELQMDAGRATIATEIITNMKEQGCADYPLEAGLRDIIRYYAAGTLTSGIASLSKDAGVNKNASENEQTKAAALTARFTKDSSGDRLQDLASTPAGQAQLRTWMDSNGLKDVAIEMFIRGNTYLSQRQSAASHLLK